MAKRDVSYLHTPEIRAKRAKAIRAAFKRKRKLAKAGLLPVVIPDGKAPVIQYEGETAKQRHRKNDDRLDIVRGLLATVAMIMGKDR